MMFAMTSSNYIFIFTFLVSGVTSAVATDSNQSTESDLVVGDPNGYQPLYVVEKDGAYDFVDPVTYDLVMNQHEYVKSGHRVLVACSDSDPSNTYVQVHYIHEEQLSDDTPILCQHPVKFFVKQQYENSGNMYLIGFMVYRDWKKFPESIFFSKLPLVEWPLPLINITQTSRSEILQSRVANYEIKYAKMLSLNEKFDAHSEESNLYQKDIDIFGFDIDLAYEEENQSKFSSAFFGSKSTSRLVKLQLAPAADFYFDAWKQASRTNLNTIPVWQELTTEWYLLEKFIRQVAAIVGDLLIITAGRHSGFSTAPSTLYTDGKNHEYLVFDTIIKHVIFKQQRPDSTWIYQEIAFFMTNDPRETYTVNDELGDENGWKFLDDQITERRIETMPSRNTDSKRHKSSSSHEIYTYFNLNKVKMLSKDSNNEETMIEVNVFEEIMKKIKGQHNALYVLKENNAYKFVDSITYDRVMNQLEFNEYSNKILAACTKLDDDDDNGTLLEIVSSNEQKFASIDGFRCRKPTKFVIKQNGDNEHYSIGFMIYDKDDSFADASSIPPDTSKHNFLLSLINVAYSKVEDYHSVATWHEIRHTKMLPIDEETDQSDPDNYEKNIDIFKFDVDKAYEMENQSKINKQLGLEPTSKWVKMQLSPSADFYFDVWKRASRNNLNTTPVWHEFATEWYQLEKFIRRVAKILGDLEIITGGTYPIYEPESGSRKTPLYFYKDAESSHLLPIFEIIFKAVSFNQQYRNGKWIRQGIIFFIINDPREKNEYTNKIAERNGWIFSSDGKKESRIVGQLMDPVKLSHLNIKTKTNISYQEFNLNNVEKLSMNESGEEIVTTVDVVARLMKEDNSKRTNVFNEIEEMED